MICADSCTEQLTGIDVKYDPINSTLYDGGAIHFKPSRKQCKAKPKSFSVDINAM